jgi:hypothetical protein
VPNADLGAFYQAFSDFFEDWQDPETGFWGPWYRAGYRVLKARDLSFTYHIIAYRKGDVRRWDRILDTLIAIRDQEYPFGWLQQGRLTNHHAYDVARILKLGWPHFNADQRARAREALDELATFAENGALNPDGSVTLRAGFSNNGIDDAFYFAASFLTTIGYCAVERPFWTDREWPGASRRCCAFAGHLTALGDATPRIRAAQARMTGIEACPVGAKSPDREEPGPVDWSQAHEVAQNHDPRPGP